MVDRTDSSSLPRNSQLVPAFLIALIVLPLVLGMWWAIRISQSGLSEIARHEDRIRAKGEPLNLTDLEAEYPQLPDAENGAVAILAIWEQEEPAFWQAFKLGSRSLPERRDQSWDPNLPYLGDDARTMTRSTEWSEANLLAAESFVDGNLDRFAEMQAALRKPAYRFPVKISDGFNALLPHLAGLRREAERFRLRADLASEHGRVDETLAAIQDIILTGHTLKSEPLKISQLVRIAIYLQALNASERLLCRTALTDVQLNVLEEQLNGIQSTKMLRRMLLSERAAFLSVFDMTPDQIAMTLGTEGGGEKTAFRWAMRVMSASGLKQADQSMMFETMEEALRLAETNNAVSFQQMKNLFDGMEREARKFPPRIFSSVFLPSMAALPDRMGSFEARRRAALIAIAVERFRSRSGRVPATLQELESKTNRLDPFDDAPLRYRPFTNGYVIYSIGPNRTDDAGAEQTRSSSRSYDDTFVVVRE